MQDRFIAVCFGACFGMKAQLCTVICADLAVLALFAYGHILLLKP